jgi:hypothetical protein
MTRAPVRIVVQAEAESAEAYDFAPEHHDSETREPAPRLFASW